MILRDRRDLSTTERGPRSVSVPVLISFTVCLLHVCHFIFPASLETAGCLAFVGRLGFYTGATSDTSYSTDKFTLDS